MNKERAKSEFVKHLQVLRNIGPATAIRLYSIGIESPEQLKKSNPEELYQQLKERTGHYNFRLYDCQKLSEAKT